MAFFGLTMVGAQDPFRECLWETLNISCIDEKVIDKAFDDYVTRKQSSNALMVGEDGVDESNEASISVSWDEAMYFLRTVYQIEPPPLEIDMLYEQMLKFECERISKEQMNEAVRTLKGMIFLPTYSS